MKLGLRIKSSFFLMLLCLTLLNCSSSDEGGESGNGEFIVASVEGISFETSNSINSVFASKIDGSQFTTFLVQGFDDSGNAMVLTIVEYEGTGTYDLAFEEAPNGTAAQYSSQQTAWSSASGDGGSGSITVAVDNNEETSGTFEFVGIEIDDQNSSRTVTSGSFSAKFDN